MKKRGLIIILTSAIMLGACSQVKTSQTEAPTEATTQAVEETSEEATVEELTQAAEGDLEAASIDAIEIDSTKSVEGTVTEATMNLITIKTDDGEDLSFAMPEDGEYKNNLSDGVTVDKKIKITYTESDNEPYPIISQLDDAE